MTIAILVILGLVLFFAIISVINFSNDEEVFAGIFLIFQVVFLVCMFFLFRDGSTIRRNFFGHSEYEAFFAGWLVFQAWSVVSSMTSFFKKKFNDSVEIGALFCFFFIFFLFIYYFWPLVAIVITFAILGIAALIASGMQESSFSGGGGCFVAEECERNDDEEENIRIRQIYNKGLSEGRKNNYKKQGIVGVVIDGILCDGNAPFGYNQEEKDAWEKGYKYGKWEN